MIMLIKDIITSFASGTAVIIGAFGLCTWKRQLRGTDDRSVAKQIILQALKLREELVAIRSPMQQIAEPQIPEESKKNMSEALLRWTANAQHYERCFKILFEKRADLEMAALEAEIHFGDLACQKVIPLINQVQEFWAEVSMHFRLTHPNVIRPNENIEELKRVHKILYRGMEDSPFDEALNNNINEIKGYFRKWL
jgi:hypothetical protein